MNIEEFYKWGKEYLNQSEETKHLSFEEGTVNSDLLLKAFTGLAYQLHLNNLVVQTGQSLENYEEMDSEQMEALIANVFLERRPGRKSRVTQTLYFRSPVNVSISPEDTSFYSKDGIEFKVDGLVSFKQSQMRKELIGVTEYYAIDISILAVNDGEGSNVQANEITVFSDNPEKFVFTTNKAPSVGGYDFETNAELKTRAERAIATRDNISDNSIYTVFNQEFGDIYDLYSVGYLHSDMQRDVLRASGCWMHHNGGMTDTYVKMPLLEIKRSGVKLVSSSYFRIRGFVRNTKKEWNTYSGNLYGGVDYERFPILYEENSEEYDSVVPAPVVYGLKVKSGDLQIPFVYHIRDFTERFSVREDIDVLVDGNRHWVKIELVFDEDVIDYTVPTGTVFYSGDKKYSTTSPVGPFSSVDQKYDIGVVYSDTVGTDYSVSANELSVDINGVTVTHTSSNYDNVIEEDSVDVSYFTHPRLIDYQQFVHLPNQTPIVDDILFKNFVPIIIEEIIISYVDKDLDPVVVRTAQSMIREYIFDWKSSEPIYLSALVLELAKNTGILFPEIGTQNFFSSKTDDVVDTDYDIIDTHDIASSPIYIRYRQYNADGTEIVRETTTQINAIINNEVQSSGYTVRYYVADSISDDYDTVIKLENPLREKKMNPGYGGIRRGS